MDSTDSGDRDDANRGDGRATHVIVFGGSGDLALRRIVPALYRLWKAGTLPLRTAVTGIALHELDDASYRAAARDAARAVLPPDDFCEESFTRFSHGLHYQLGDVREEAAYAGLAARTLNDSREDCLFYCACAPELAGEIATHLANFGLAGEAFRRRAGSGSGFRRLLVEKPFGTDLEAARTLNAILHHRYREEDIFRVDHYLGKDAVQNLLYFRFANTVFEPLWNRKYIDRVEIALDEDAGIGSRGGYYDHAGAGRDMLQNHLMQLFCLCAMEPPKSFAAEDVREEKVRLLRSVRRFDPADPDSVRWVRAQYGASASGQGYRAYTDEAQVDPASTTETYVAIRLYVDSWRWNGVPFVLRTGKALAARKGEIVVYFRQCPVELPGARPDANQLALRIQPEEGVSLRFNTRASGGGETQHEELLGMIGGSASAAQGPYERLLADAFRGDSTLFVRFDETEEAWRIVDPLLARWKSEGAAGLAVYPAGGEGPDLASLYTAPSMLPKAGAKVG